MKITTLSDIQAELDFAKTHGDFRSYHEGIAIIREEYLELEKEIFKRKPDKIRVKEEALQVIATCLKLMEFAENETD